MEPLVIGLDLGTTNCKALALSADGRVVATTSSAYRLRFSQSGWAEQDPEDIWRGATEALRDLSAQLPSTQVAGLSLSGAMHSLLPVDEDGAPLAAAMTWADQRAAPHVRALRAQADPHALYRRTGCPLQSTYHPARLRWWQEEAPGLARRAARFVALKDWCLHRLSGAWATDWGLASTTGLLDIHRLTWDEEALALSGISPDHLPPLVSPRAAVGKLTASAAAQAGLPQSLSIVAGNSDGALANLGAGAARPGQAVVTVGTSGAVRRVVDRPWLDSAERTWCYILSEGHWFAGGAINNGGLVLQWVREKFYPDLPEAAGYEQLMRDAASVAPGAGGIFVLPYFTGERSPHWNPDARAVIFGLGLEHERAAIARAALEGVAFCLADVWQALTDRGTPAGPVRLTGGITRSPVWAQILADVLGVPLAPVEAGDASAIGAAILGHWVLGHIPGPDAFIATTSTGPAITPDPERHAAYAARHRMFQSLYRQLWHAAA